LSDNKKYYYLKFKENYFEQDHIRVIEAMDNGYIYSLIILKLYLKCLKFEGQLKINDAIPYMANKIDILAKVIGHDQDHVMHAINLAKDLGIVEILKTGEIFMADIQQFIGQGSSESDRIREYRKLIKSRNNKKLTGCTKSVQKYKKSTKKLQNCTPELELELEKEINIYIDCFNFWNEKEIIKHSNDFYKRNIKKKHKTIIDEYGKDIVLKAIDNYNIILKANEYYWNHKWNFFDFIARGIDKFVDAAAPFENYKDKKNKKEQFNLKKDLTENQRLELQQEANRANEQKELLKRIELEKKRDPGIEKETDMLYNKFMKGIK
jgi:predicted phage replisome organizer